MPLLALILVSQVLYHLHGEYKPVALMVVTLAFFIVFLNRSRWSNIGSVFGKSLPWFTLQRAILATGLLWSVETAFKLGPIYLKSTVIAATLRTLYGLSALGFLGLLWRPQKIHRFAWVLLCIPVLAKIFVLVGVPSPYIDVFTVCQEAVDYLLSGKNPYTQPYSNIYLNDPHFDPAYVPLFPYPPASLFWMLPFKGIFGDVRFAYLAAEIIALFVFLKKFKWTQFHWELALLWSYFPVNLFILEQAWTDSLLVMIFTLVFGMLCSAASFSSLGLGLLFGTALAAKQYSVIPVILILTSLLKRRGFKFVTVTSLWTGTTALAFCLPFLIWDAPGTLTRWAAATSTSRASLGALTWSAFLERSKIYTWNLPFSHAVIVGAMLTAMILILWKPRRVGQGEVPWGLVATTLFVAFAFSYQAFCNYYYFMALFLWFELAYRIAIAKRIIYPA